MNTTTTPDGFTNWHFSRFELIALLAHASTDETRFGMCGIGLDTTIGAATATDGHRAAKVWGSRANYDCAVLPGRTLVVGRDTVDLAIKSAKRDDEIVLVTRRADEPVLVQVRDQVTTARLIDAAHPPVEQILPKHEIKNHKGVAAGINAYYLADLQTVSRACPPVIKDLPRGKKEKRYDALTVFPPVAELDPWFARISCKQNATEWAVAIMPVRL